MERVLGKKQSIQNEDWLKAGKRIEELVSREELDEKVHSTVEEIRQMTDGKKAAYAWSAGKDSLVLGEICQESGVTDCMMAICNLEYPDFLKWVDQYKPKGLEIINTGQDLEWLSKHLNMLFPQDSATAAKWFSIVQHRAQAKYYKVRELDLILLGRRRADGNYCGRRSNIYTDGKGVVSVLSFDGALHDKFHSHCSPGHLAKNIVRSICDMRNDVPDDLMRNSVL